MGRGRTERSSWGNGAVVWGKNTWKTIIKNIKYKWQYLKFLPIWHWYMFLGLWLWSEKGMKLATTLNMLCGKSSWWVVSPGSISSSDTAMFMKTWDQENPVYTTFRSALQRTVKFPMPLPANWAYRVYLNHSSLWKHISGEHAVYLFHCANQLFFSQGQVLYRTHHPTRSGENEEPRVQAGFPRYWDKDDFCPNWNSLFLHCLFPYSKSKWRQLILFLYPSTKKAARAHQLLHKWFTKNPKVNI